MRINLVQKAFGLLLTLICTGAIAYGQAFKLRQDACALYGGSQVFVQDKLMYVTQVYGVGKYAPSTAIIDIATGQANDLTAYNFTPKQSNVCTEPDGQGGWYAGNAAEEVVNGVTYSWLLHVLPNGSLDPQFKVRFAKFNAGDLNTILDLLVIGHKLYVAGAFDSAAGVARKDLVALDAQTGALLSWNPRPSSGIPAHSVCALSTTDGKLFAGGEFSFMSSVTRRGLAAFDTATGLLLPWNPNLTYTGSLPNPVVLYLYAYRGIVYFSAIFTTVQGVAQTYAAAVSASDATLQNWNPGRYFNAMAAIGDTIYMGGSFTSLSGQVRNNLAAYDANNLRLLSWAPTGVDNVSSLAVRNDTLLVGASTKLAGAGKRYGLSAFDRRSGQLLGFKCNLSNAPTSLHFLGSRILCSGPIGVTEMQPRNGMACIDMVSGQATSFNPPAFSTYSGLTLAAMRGGRVIVGGQFDTIGRTTVPYLAELDSATGQVTAWRPNPSDQVNKLIAYGDTLLIGGAFNTLGGQTVRGLAPVRMATRQVITNWPYTNGFGLNGSIFNMVLKGKTLYAFGSYTVFAGFTRKGGAAVDLSTRLVQNWGNTLPTTTHRFSSLKQVLAYDNVLLLNGTNLDLNGVQRSGPMLVPYTSASPTVYYPQNNANISIANLFGGKLLATGTFTQVANRTISYMALIDTLTGLAADTVPRGIKPSDAIYLTEAFDQGLVLRGAFHRLDNVGRKGLSLLEYADCNLATPVVAGASVVGLCQGDSIRLTASATGPGTYRWSTGATGASITVKKAGTYSAYLEQGHCLSRRSNSIEVSVLQTPPAAVITAQGPVSFCAGDSVRLAAASGYRYRWSTGDTTQSILVRDSGFYSVQYSNSNCQGSASTPVRVRVFAQPQAPVITAQGGHNAGNQLLFCQGDTVRLSANNGAYQALWSTGATASFLAVTQPGTFTLRIVNQACSTAMSPNLQIAYAPRTSPSFSQVANKLINTCATCDSVQWYQNGALLAFGIDTVSISQSGTYRLCNTTDLGCVDCTERSITITTTQAQVLTGISVSPNPTDGRLMLSCGSGQQHDVQLAVYDNLGRLKEEHTLNIQGTTNLNLNAALPEGLYILQIREGQAVLRETVLVQRR